MSKMWANSGPQADLSFADETSDDGYIKLFLIMSLLGTGWFAQSSAPYNNIQLKGGLKVKGPLILLP